MSFSITELKVISELGKGNKKIIDIAKAIKISLSQTYRIAGKLSQNGIVALSEGVLLPESKTHVNLFLKLLSRAVNLSIPLSGTGLQIYQALIDPNTIRELEKETGLHKTTILKKINQGRKMSLLLIENKTYKINEKIWQDLKEALVELKKYEESIDPRIPINSVIYFKNEKEIVFSNQEKLDAEKTAFSVYENYGIRLLLVTNYYYLPKKKLSKEQVFKHSLYIAEKDLDPRNLIFIALFYAKYKLSIKHQIIEMLHKIFLGEKVPGYPTLAEIKERAKIYKIKI